MSNSTDFDQILALFHDWWPAALMLALAYFGVRFLLRGSRSQTPQLDAVNLAIHEIRTTLACSEHQAKQLLAVYNGDSTKAINEVKTGRAVLPGAEASELARFGGEMRAFQVQPQGLCIDTHDRGETVLPIEGEGYLVVGVIDSEQRPDSAGNARADRGKTYGQLFWKADDEWTRFLLNASRSNYFLLGEEKQNSAVRNFRLLLGILTESVPNLMVHTSVATLDRELRATHYKNLAEFEGDAFQILKDESGLVE